MAEVTSVLVDETALTPLQRLRVTIACMKGMNQHDAAALLGINAGRVAEAVKACRYAAHNPTDVSELVNINAKLRVELDNATAELESVRLALTAAKCGVDLGGNRLERSVTTGLAATETM